MPELPEVETTLHGIHPFIHQQVIIDIIIRQHQLRYPVTDNIKEKIAGKTIKSLHRRAKYLILELSSGYLLIHLGMSGHLRIVSSCR